MYKKNNGRTTYKSNRRTGFKKTGGYQNFKARNKGNVSQQYNKYLKLAKEAFRSGDRVQSEYYYQYTDHYYRLMIELGISIEENTYSDENKQSLSEDSNKEEQSETTVASENLKSDEDNIESIPFISEPTKEKRSKTNK